MGGSINKAIIVGHLGQDPELRSTDKGMSVCNFSVATSESWMDNGEKKEKTEWHRVVVWGRQAEICEQYLKKGRLVYVEGKIQTRKYEDRDGADRYSTEIIARDVQFLGGKPQEDFHGIMPTVAHLPKPKKKKVDLSQPMPDDDIPF